MPVSGEYIRVGVMPMMKYWPAVLEELKQSLPPQTFTTWISPINPLKTEGNHLVLEVPNRFFADWLRDNNLSQTISAALTRASRCDANVRFEIKKAAKAHLTPHPEEAPEEHAQHPRKNFRKSPLVHKYTFDTFVVGASNQFAHAACLAVAQKSHGSYNPLFIYAGVGLGKTHLLNAIGNHKLSHSPDAKICYVSSEEFMNELIQALANRKMSEFRAKYRKMDLLLIDDIQFIAGKERTQEEFFHTFNALYENHSCIVLASDKFPKDIDNLEDRLRSRFQWGLIADIQPPDIETKIAILKKKAELESLYLPNDVAIYLASLFLSSIRDLEGALVRISAFSSLTHAPITVELAKKVLKDTVQLSPQRITMDDILKAVSKHFSLPVSDLKAKKRTKNIAAARQIAMYLAREHTDLSTPEIGQSIGGRDHSTVIYGHSKMSKSIKTDSSVRSDVSKIETSLGV